MKNVFALFGLCVAAAGSLSAAPVDGTVWQCRNFSDNRASPVKWKDYWSWQNGVVASDGGVATFLFAGNVEQTVDGLTLKGVDFTTCATPYFYGKALTLTGDDAFLKGSVYNVNGVWNTCTPRVELQLQGTGANTVTKTGGANYILIHPITSIGTLVLDDGSLTMTNSAGGTFLTDASVVLRAGTADWAPVLSAGRTATASLATGAGATLSYGTGSGWISVNKGAGDCATLTVGPLAREPNGVLTLRPKSGVAALGKTEIIKSTMPPAMVNGMVDASIVARDETADSKPYYFLAYDAEKGFVPATYTEGLEGGPASIAHVTEDTVVTKDTHVHALVIENRANLVVSNGVTLTIGDGVHPAAIIFNTPTSPNNTYYTFAGEGTIDFGSSEGILYHSTGSSGRGVYLSTKITGGKDVSLVSGDGGAFSFYCLNGAYCQWQGSTHVSGCRLWYQNPDALPSGSDVYLHGGERLFSAQLLPNYSLSQHLHLKGRGPRKTDDIGAFYTQVGLSLNGPVTLDGDSEFYLIRDSNGNVMTTTFNQPVDGPGGIVFSSFGTAVFNATNTFAGTLTQSGNCTLRINAAGTFGQGPVMQTHGTGVIHLNTRDYVVTNALSSAGTVKFDATTTALNSGANKLTSKVVPAGASFLGPTALNKVALTTATTLGVGANVAVAETSGETGETVLHGAAEESVLTLGGNAADQTFTAQLTDGAGRLSVVKDGDNAVTFQGAKTYTGATTVRAGTLRLEPDLLKSDDVAYWLDATKSETITRDEAGVVTAWASANGNGVSFTATTRNPSYSETDMGGLPGILFETTNKDSDYDYLMANATCQQRTVFIATTTHNWSGDLPGIFGCHNSDFGQRYQGGQWRTDSSSYTFITKGSSEIGVNGVMGTGRFSKNVNYVLTMMHGDDTAKSTGSVFIPCLGGYSSNGRYGGSYGEVIAFKRILTEAERKTVENYLAKKWGVNANGFHADVVAEPLLAPETALEISARGTFDLNGADVTVASLSGEGRIVNTSTTPATLRVTGACDFRGVLDGDVALVRTGTAGTTLALDLRGASRLELDGGTADLSAYTPTPPRAGLLYWLDASRPETVLRDASGVVTNWRNRVTGCGVSNGFFKVWGEPTYTTSAAGFNGKPALHFVTADNLVSPVDTDTRTVFYVACADGTQTMNTGTFGTYNKDYGFRYTSQSSLNAGTGSGWAYVGDYLRVNGTLKTSLTDGNLSVPNKKPYVLVCRLGDFHQAIPSLSRVGRNTLNKYIGNGGATEWMAEVIAYDRALSDDEILSVEKYLMDKWVNNVSATVPAENATLANGTGGLVLAGGAALSGGLNLGDGRLVVKVDALGRVETVSVDGNLVLGTGATLEIDDYTKAEKGTRHTVLSVSGDVTGDFSGTNLSGKRWKLRRQGATWYLYTADGTVIIFQ